MHPTDPNSTHPDPSRFGGIGPTSNSAELGTITSVDTVRLSYTVRTVRGRVLPGVPRIRYSPNDLAVLPVGTSVVVRFDLGLPVIDGVLDLPATPAEDAGIPATGVSGFGTQTTNFQTGGFRAAGEPSDLIPGDTLFANKSGARVGVLEGGVATLRGSGMAQVNAYGLNDLVEIISRNFRHITDMGVSEVKNTDGRINWSFRGASDQTNEAGGDEENWTIRVDLGAEGDLFNFELTTPQGQTLFKLHVDSNGRCSIFGLDGVVTQSGNRNGEPHIEEHGGDAESTVHGARAIATGGDIDETTEGSHVQTVDGDHTLMVGNDCSTAAVRDIGIAAGRNVAVTATGDKRGGTALRVDAQGGDYVTNVGQPTYPSPKYTVNTVKGDIAFRSSLGGNFLVETATGEFRARARRVVFNTETPDSVVLGGNALTAHVVKFEQLEILLRALFLFFDTHTHPGVGTPPAVSMSSALSGLISSLKSLNVGVGA